MKRKSSIIDIEEKKKQAQEAKAWFCDQQKARALQFFRGPSQNCKPVPENEYKNIKIDNLNYFKTGLECATNCRAWIPNILSKNCNILTKDQYKKNSQLYTDQTRNINWFSNKNDCLKNIASSRFDPQALAYTLAEIGLKPLLYNGRGTKDGINTKNITLLDEQIFAITNIDKVASKLSLALNFDFFDFFKLSNGYISLNVSKAMLRLYMLYYIYWFMRFTRISSYITLSFLIKDLFLGKILSLTDPKIEKVEKEHQYLYDGLINRLGLHKLVTPSKMIKVFQDFEILLKSVVNDLLLEYKTDDSLVPNEIKLSDKNRDNTTVALYVAFSNLQICMLPYIDVSDFKSSTETSKHELDVFFKKQSDTLVGPILFDTIILKTRDSVHVISPSILCPPSSHTENNKLCFSYTTLFKVLSTLNVSYFPNDKKGTYASVTFKSKNEKEDKMFVYTDNMFKQFIDEQKLGNIEYKLWNKKLSIIFQDVLVYFCVLNKISNLSIKNLFYKTAQQINLITDINYKYFLLLYICHILAILFEKSQKEAETVNNILESIVSLTVLNIVPIYARF